MSNEEAPPANSSRDDQANTNFPSSSSNAAVSRPPTAPWLRLKDPRIVRVSRAFGGKDRHSKVCTIRGLRDRRVRLSVPTAIQLYDLQERLGLNQPSKVVDWLLDAAKQEIDGLPPLPLPPPSANFGEGPSGTHNFWTSTISDAIWRAKSKEIAKEKEEENTKEMPSTTTSNVDGNNNNSNNNNNNNSASINDHPLFPGLLNNNGAVPNYGYHQNWEPSSSSNFGLAQATDLHNFINVASMPSTLSLATTQSYFPSHNVAAAAAAEIDPRQFNHHLQMLSSTTGGASSRSSSTSNSQDLMANLVSAPGILYPNSQNMRGSYLSMMTKLVHSSNNQPNKGQESP